VRAQLVGHSGDFVNLKIPDGVSGQAQAVIRQAIRDSFVAGFRLVAYLAAGLAAASALASWLLIAGKTGVKHNYRTLPVETVQKPGS